MPQHPALRALQFPGLQLRQLQAQRRDEAQDDLIKALKVQPETADRYATIFDLLDKDVAETDARLRNPAMEARAAAGEQAQIAGFPSSQALAEYLRNQEQEKLRLPIEEAKTRALGSYKIAELQGRQAMDRLREQQAFQTQQTEAERNFLKSLSEMAGPNTMVGSIGLGKGRVTLRPVPAPPGTSSILNNIREEIGRMEVGGSRNPGSVQQLTAAITQYLNSLRLDPSTQRVFLQILRDPDFFDPDVPAEEFLESPQPGEEDEYNQFLQLLLSIRGH